MTDSLGAIGRYSSGVSVFVGGMAHYNYLDGRTDCLT